MAEERTIIAKPTIEPAERTTVTDSKGWKSKVKPQGPLTMMEPKESEYLGGARAGGMEDQNDIAGSEDHGGDWRPEVESVGPRTTEKLE